MVILDETPASGGKKGDKIDDTVYENRSFVLIIAKPSLVC